MPLQTPLSTNMNDCPIGFDELVRLYRQRQDDLLHTLTAGSPVTDTGMPGEPLPYIISSDPLVTAVILGCLFLLAVTMRQGRKHLLQHAIQLFSNRRRTSLFDESTGIDNRYTAAMSLITCVLCGICLFDYFSFHEPLLIHRVPHSWLLGLYAGLTVMFICLKSLFYTFTNWIFFYQEQRRLWIQTYFDMTGSMSFLLFPLVMLSIYYNPAPLVTEYCCTGVLAFSKIVLFYKCSTNFSNHFYGFLHLIFYFCALEIIPVLLLWSGLGYINSFLILKF